MSSAPASSSADVPWIGAERLLALAPMSDAADAVEAAFAVPGAGSGDPLRSVVETVHGQLLLMPSESADCTGVKVASVAPGNPARGLPRIQGVYVLLDAATLTPLALMDGVALTSVRTPATSAVSIRHCAVDDAAHLVVFGTGPQAWGHVQAMAAVRPLRRVGVVGRDAGRLEAFLARVRSAGYQAYAAQPASVRDADVVCLCTSSREPLIDGRWLPLHAHVVAVGSHEPDGREVDGETVRRSAVVVETRKAAYAEAGDLLLAIAEGAVEAGRAVTELHELVTGRGPARDELTLFKSVGLAHEDLAVARLVYQRWIHGGHG